MSKDSAFSWVEILIVIAILWIVAVIAIPNLPVLFEAHRVAKGQQAAMSLSSLALAARNSGHAGWGSRSEAVRGLINGVAVTNPADQRIVLRFQTKFLTPQERAAAAAFLAFDGATLIYVPGGGQATNL